MQPTAVRPGTVTVLGILAYLVALLQVLSAVSALVLLLRPGRAQQLFDAPVSDWYWVTSAALSVFLFFAYVWLARGVFAGLDYAWTVVNLLALLNLIFGVLYVFQGTGFPMIILSVLVLLLNNTRGVREWYASA